MEKNFDSMQRGEMKVNPSTHALELRIPLRNYPGRAGTGLPITLSYSSKLWRMKYAYLVPANNSPTNSSYTAVNALFSEHSSSGWTTGLGLPEIDVESQHNNYDLSSGQPSATCNFNNTGPTCCFIDRIIIHMPDGSSHELRSTDQPFCYPNITVPDNLYAVDGSRLRYQRSTTTLFLPDGSRYILGTNPKYIDRNGNTLTANPSSNQWTDTLGRVIGLPFAGAPTNGDQIYNVPGVGGTSLSYTFRWRNLSGVLTPDPGTGQPPPLRYTGNSCIPGQSTTPSLFTSDTVGATYVCPGSTFNPVVLYQIVLPHAASDTNPPTYTFTYNVYGEIDKVVYPTGGYERFAYGMINGASYTRSAYSQAVRGVVDRWISAKGDGTDEAQMHWQYPSALISTDKVMESEISPEGTRTDRLIYRGPENSSWGYEDVLVGMAYEERVYNSSGQMMRRKLTDWTKTGPIPDCGGQSWCNATRSARAAKEIEILLDTSGDALTSTTTHQYDGDLNVTSTSEYDYVPVIATTGQSGASSSIPLGALLRTSEATYLVNDTAIDAATRNNYRNRNLVALPTSTRIRNGVGTMVAQGSINYDEATYPLVSIGAVTGWADPATTVRGNATTISKWLDTTGNYIQTHTTYNQCGSPLSVTDAKGNTSQIGYSSTYAYAYPTSTASAIPGTPYGSTTALTTSAIYDSSTGLVTSTTDANDQTTTYSYADDLGNIDSLNRLRKITFPTGGWIKYTYNNTVGALWVRTQTSQTASLSQDFYQSYDSMGRPSRTFKYENVDAANVWLTTATQYDAMNRVWRVSNTYRSSGSSAPINPSGNWTTTLYDQLGRMTSMTTPDNAVVTTSYSGNQVTVTDQAGKKRQSVTDGLGRLTRITEDPGGALAAQTDYTYDALGNLRKVTQGTQARYFMYDSLSRLIRARNPEQNVNANLTGTDAVTGNTQWATAYAYDNNGNLTIRTDARGLVSNYAYDGLNRNTEVNYSDGSGITRYYDGATLGRGLPWYSTSLVTSGANSQTITDSYDAAGRTLSQRQRFYWGGAWLTYPVSNTYDLTGHVATQTYPSGRTVSYTYDNAGRTVTFTGNLGDGVSRTYMSALAFDDSGRMTREQFGTDTPLYNKRHYNVRGQLYDMRLSSVNDDSNWNRGVVVNYYSLSNYGFGMSGADNNGNLYVQQYWIPNDDAISSYSYQQQNYQYDALNRITWVSEFPNGSPNTGNQNYQYDRWGNRTINATNSFGTGINTQQFTVDAATNRLGVPAGQAGTMTYDANGNLQNDTYTGFGVRAYDAENRMVSATDSSGGQSQYIYDADGRRVRRQTGTEQSWQIYGVEGELVAEYAAATSVTVPQKEYGYRNGEL